MMNHIRRWRLILTHAADGWIFGHAPGFPVRISQCVPALANSARRRLGKDLSHALNGLKWFSNNAIGPRQCARSGPGARYHCYVINQDTTTYPDVLYLEEPVEDDDRAKAIEAEGGRLIGDLKYAIAGKVNDSTTAEVEHVLSGLKAVLAMSANPFRDDAKMARYSDGSPVFSLVPVDPDAPPQVPSIGELIGTAHYLWEVVEMLHLISGYRVVVAHPPIQDDSHDYRGWAPWCDANRLQVQGSAAESPRRRSTEHPAPRTSEEEHKR
jgi:hypothetical protein